MKNNYKMGIDIGSTTIKVVIIDEKNEIVYEEYRRHLSNIKITIVDLLKETYEKVGDLQTKVCVTGSGGLMISQWLGHKQVETTLIYAYADTEAKRKAIEKAMGTGLAGTESVNYTVSDEDMLRRLYGL